MQQKDNAIFAEITRRARQMAKPASTTKGKRSITKEPNFTERIRKARQMAMKANSNAKDSPRKNSCFPQNACWLLHTNENIQHGHNLAGPSSHGTPALVADGPSIYSAFQCRSVSLQQPSQELQSTISTDFALHGLAKSSMMPSRSNSESSAALVRPLPGALLSAFLMGAAWAASSHTNMSGHASSSLPDWCMATVPI
jgi:hypothetical protein